MYPGRPSSIGGRQSHLAGKGIQWDNSLPQNSVFSNELLYINVFNELKQGFKHILFSASSQNKLSQ